ncbi:VOC family protein [Mammaliicoccus stepanovicii]|uniref:Dioxygenase n=1 Tax=Mammaliicoccus stepanovicii TaxID=643214 RepID=A0A240ACW8_9STAP|nr:VOC family protein [Mammaliicoccus stepanovicii]PNZ77832.1 ring-cleaving dioxygenase [Mammaliicoccus stepanovicii]GGI43158.1 glyoxalase [Mammaliicoccus stepanovicii]SNV81237.1 dioxygenase [Mammaliicoccus stepanovicii]
MVEILGHHHISMLTKDAKLNKVFFVEKLGLRLYLKTVNQDDPSMYHLFYGDEVGSNGTSLTFFELKPMGQTHKGTNAISRIGLLVPDEASLSYWKDRFEYLNVDHDDVGIYNGMMSLKFRDHEGLEMVLIPNNDRKIPADWRKNRYTDIPEEHQIMGMGPIEFKINDITSMKNFLENDLNFKLVDSESELVYTIDQEGLYSDIILKEEEGQKERPGKGSIHHLALAVKDEAELNKVKELLDNKEVLHSGIVDRDFFKSLYYRHSHILIEFATDGPGLPYDDVEQLGQQLDLPEFLEPRRQEIEDNLEPI